MVMRNWLETIREKLEMKKTKQTPENRENIEASATTPELFTLLNEESHASESAPFPSDESLIPPQPASTGDIVGLQSSGPKPRKRRSSKAPASSAIVGMSLPGRQVPFSIEAEQGVLGCILLDPRNNLSLFASKLKGKDQFEGIFYDIRHQTLINQMIQMNEEGAAIDELTLIQRLRDRALLDSAGGVPYISSLKDAPPSPLNMEYYLNIVRDKYLLRSLVQTCTTLTEDVFSNPSDVESLMDQAEKEILRINGEWVQTSSLEMNELVKSAFQLVQSYFNRKGELTGIGTGFPDLDRMTAGLHAGEMIVIAARPSMGKTSLAMNIAEYVAIEQGEPVGVFSLEMTAESLVMRMLCSRARVSMQNIRSGTLSTNDFTKMTGEAGKLASAPIYIDDTPGLSILNLRSRARRMMEKGIKLFVIDYLQLLHSSMVRGDSNRQQEIADISNGIKSLAKELGVPIIVLSQLNRDVEKEKNRAPKLSDLRESGAIEQDADLVLLIYRPPASANDSRRGEEEEEQQSHHVQTSIEVKLVIAKQRNGPTGEVDLIFLKNYTRFDSVARVRHEDVR
jgi:replicative DNA helicase